MNDTLALEPISLRSLAPWTALAALFMLLLHLADREPREPRWPEARA